MNDACHATYPPRELHIGVDFDNTIICYDELFHRCAVELGLIPPVTPRLKSAVRAFLWSLPDGNRPWTELQGLVYGKRINEATPCPGALEFFAACMRRGICVSIVSHKLVYPALGPRVNLRKAALKWIRDHDVFQGTGKNMIAGKVYFEDSRSDKIARIKNIACTHFIDDLPELFCEPGFPKSIEKILYAAGYMNEPPQADDMRIFADWRSIAGHFGL